MKGIQIKAAGRELEVLVYEQIGEDAWSSGVTAKAFAEQVKAAGMLDRIRVRINSSGGYVVDALGIYNTLRGHPARVVVDIDGAALSSAALVAMAGDEIRMADNALMMIHSPWAAMVAGTSEELRKAADTIDKAAESIITIFVNRTGKSRDEIKAALEAETWFSADEALDFGLIDSITTGVKAAANLGEQWRAKVPERLRGLLNAQEGHPAPTIRPAAAGGYTPRGLARFIPQRK